MGLADRDYYREHTQELERQAEASVSRFGGVGRRTVVIDADGTLGPEPIGLRWWWQTLRGPRHAEYECILQTSEREALHSLLARVIAPQLVRFAVSGCAYAAIAVSACADV